MPTRPLLAPALALLCAAGLSAGPAVMAADPRPVPPAPGTPAAPALPPDNTVVARVDGAELLLSDVKAAQQNLPPQAQKLPLEQIYPQLLDRLVDGMLILEAGRKEHLDQNPDLQARLKHYEDRLVQEAYINRAIKQAETEDRLKARYETLLKEKPAQEEVRARQILLTTEAEAKSVIAELDKGGNFTELAKQHSPDPGAASDEDLGYSSRDDMAKEMGPEFADAVFAIAVGQHSKAPIKSRFGWHVIKIEDRRTAKPPSFEEAREQLSHTLANEMLDAKLHDLRGAAKIEEFGLDGKPLPAGK
jgi:peptidyl-prolyl cis-trans isomerase C